MARNPFTPSSSFGSVAQQQAQLRQQQYEEKVAPVKRQQEFRAQLSISYPGYSVSQSNGLTVVKAPPETYYSSYYFPAAQSSGEKSYSPEILYFRDGKLVKQEKYATGSLISLTGESKFTRDYLQSRIEYDANGNIIGGEENTFVVGEGQAGVSRVKTYTPEGVYTQRPEPLGTITLSESEQRRIATKNISKDNQAIRDRLMREGYFDKQILQRFSSQEPVSLEDLDSVEGQRFITIQQQQQMQSLEDLDNAASLSSREAAFQRQAELQQQGTQAVVAPASTKAFSLITSRLGKSEALQEDIFQPTPNRATIFYEQSPPKSREGLLAEVSFIDQAKKQGFTEYKPQVYKEKQIQSLTLLNTIPLIRKGKEIALFFKKEVESASIVEERYLSPVSKFLLPESTSQFAKQLKSESFTEFANSQPSILSAPGIKGKVKAGTSVAIAGLGAAFGSVYTGLREKPATTALTFYGIGKAAKVGIAGFESIGFSSKVAGGITSGALLSGFIGASAISEPATVTTPVGLISTGGQIATFSLIGKGKNFLTKPRPTGKYPTSIENVDVRKTVYKEAPIGLIEGKGTVRTQYRSYLDVALGRRTFVTTDISFRGVEYLSNANPEAPIKQFELFGGSGRVKKIEIYSPRIFKKTTTTTTQKVETNIFKQAGEFKLGDLVVRGRFEPSKSSDVNVGQYNLRTKKISLFPDKISDVSNEFKINQKNLARYILTHEVGHKLDIESRLFDKYPKSLKIKPLPRQESKIIEKQLFPEYSKRGYGEKEFFTELRADIFAEYISGGKGSLTDVKLFKGLKGLPSTKTNLQKILDYKGYTGKPKYTKVNVEPGTIVTSIKPKTSYRIGLKRVKSIDVLSKRTPFTVYSRSEVKYGEISKKGRIKVGKGKSSTEQVFVAKGKMTDLGSKLIGIYKDILPKSFKEGITIKEFEQAKFTDIFGQISKETARVRAPEGFWEAIRSKQAGFGLSKKAASKFLKEGGFFQTGVEGEFIEPKPTYKRPKPLTAESSTGGATILKLSAESKLGGEVSSIGKQISRNIVKSYATPRLGISGLLSGAVTQTRQLRKVQPNIKSSGEIGLIGQAVSSPKTLARSIPITIPKTSPLNIAKSIPKTIPQSIPKTIPQTIPKTIPQTIPKTIPQTIPKNISRTVPKSITRQISKSITKTTTLVPVVPILPPSPPRIPVLFPILESKSKKKKKKRCYSLMGRYQPSLGPSAYARRGRIPSILTGIEERLIPKNRFKGGFR